MYDDELHIEPAYIAGLFERGGSFGLRVEQKKRAPHGYAFDVVITLRTSSETLVSVLDAFSMQEGIGARVVKDSEHGYAWSVDDPIGVRLFLGAIGPHVFHRHEDVELLLTEVLPRVERQDELSKAGIIALVEAADRLETGGGAPKKYTPEYFKDEFSGGAE